MNIVLIEDNPDDEALALKALKKANIMNKIVVLRDGAQAADYLFGGKGQGGLEGQPLPAVVLLDIKLPKIDGLEILRRLRANPRTQYLPVVILTSSNEERDLLRGYELRANSYVRKPVDFTQFSEAVRQLGLYWVLLNEAPPEAR
jgi:two-component system response regulator